MNTNPLFEILRPGLLLALTVTSLLASGTARAERDEYAGLNAPPARSKVVDISSWSIAFDNDILVPGSRDQDYTYGINFTYAGKPAENQWASLHDSLDWINLKLDLEGFAGSGIAASKIEYGMFGFTPEDISLASANPDDRPYAMSICTLMEPPVCGLMEPLLCADFQARTSVLFS